MSSYSNKLNAYSYVLAVRGGQCGSPAHFIDNGNGTVTDTDTGLMWQKDTSPDSISLAIRTHYCENLSLSGYNDWRLPDYNELHSLVDYGVYNPAIDPIFSNTETSCYLSSTTIPSGAYSVWSFNFSDGVANKRYKQAGISATCGRFAADSASHLVIWMLIVALIA